MAQKGMRDLDSRAWRAFHKIGTSLLPHLGRQITNHSGISGAEYVVLVALSESTLPSMNLNRLARILGWEISRMSHQVSRMEEIGLVKKTKNLEDSRCFDVSITSNGKKIAESAIPLQSKEINHCFSDVLTQAQMKALIDISEAISKHMKEHHPLNKKENTHDKVTQRS
ncbi:MAG: MarR family transcriptional regulator [Actinobacteria bacterium]|jgi:DNA-binding MarR family transcriptional regulator|nr:MarR family transcriptional regulator [Actinomycetota bacterium]